jgi:glycerate dehydrogenase
MDLDKLLETGDKCINEAPPACTAWCPLHVEVKAFVEEIERGSFDKAYKLMEKRIPIARIIGMICDHPCEDICVRGKKGGNILIGELEKAAVKYGYSKPKKGYPLPSSNKTIAVIGSGLTGLTASYDLVKKGHKIDIYEMGSKAGGRLWENNPDWCFWDYPLIELAGKTMGIIGLGRIGRTTGRIAKALGMNVIAYDEYPSDEGREIAQYMDLDRLFENSDVICLHCPLFPSTQGIINKDTIAKMKDGVIIINNSRGPLIVEQDLADALNSGKVYAAGLDVVSVEPIRSDNPLLRAKNCIITPHISWAPKESRQRLMDIAVDNLKAFLNGTPVNIVNR